MAVLPDGRIVSNGYDWSDESRGWVLVWNPDAPGTWPIELGTHDSAVGSAVAVLPDGRVVSGDVEGRLLVWDPATPGAAPVELGTHAGGVYRVVVLPDGQIVSSGADKRLRIWDVQTRSSRSVIACSPTALAVGAAPSGDTVLVVAHQDVGLSAWIIPDSRRQA